MLYRPEIVRGGQDAIIWPGPWSQKNAARQMMMWRPESENGDWTTNPLQRLNMMEKGIRFGKTFSQKPVREKKRGLSKSEAAAWYNTTLKTQSVTDNKMKPALAGIVPFNSKMTRTNIPMISKHQQVFIPAEVSNGQTLNTKVGKFFSNV